MLKVAVDDGYGNVKVMVKEEDGTLRQHVVPTHFQPGAHGGVMNVQDGQFDTMVIKTEGQTYTVGDSSQHGTTEFDDFPYHPANRAIVRYAIAQAGVPDDAEYELLVGLPIGQYYVGGMRNQALLDRKVDHHKKPVYRVTDTEQELSAPSSVQCYPQSVMAGLFAFPGEDLDSYAVVDIGHRTTDVTVITDGRVVFQRSGGLMDLGVSVAQRAFRTQIESRFQVNFESSYEKAFRNRKVRLSGTVYEVPEEWNLAVQQSGEAIRQAVEQIIRPVHTMDRILLIGGGAYVFEEVLKKHWPQVVRADDPVFANTQSWIGV